MRHLDLLTLDQLPALVMPTGAIMRGADAARFAPTLLPGSFNPLHDGHWALAAAAQLYLGRTVAFELSVVNVDKPELTCAEVRRRAAQFVGHSGLWITRAPQFTDKANQFPGATFVIGADTALRLFQARYYADDDCRMLRALASLCDCRFLVAARADAAGRLLTLADMPVPAAHRHLFSALPPSLFRSDLSSTQLRQREPWKTDP